MKYIAESRKANICLTCFSLRMVSNRRCFIAIAFQLCCRTRYYESAGKSGGLKLNGAHQLLVYVDDVSILGRSVHTIKENAEALIVASKEIGLEVNTDKTKYVVMYRYQKAGLSHNIKTDNSSIETVEEFKYL